MFEPQERVKRALERSKQSERELNRDRGMAKHSRG
jgi:hypothetical protein